MKLKKNNKYFIFLFLLLILNIYLTLILKSSITNYKFSKPYISDTYNKLSVSFLILSIVVVIIIPTIIPFIKTNLKLIKALITTVLLIVIILNLSLFYKTCIKTNVKITGNSMYPTIKDTEYVKCNFIKNETNIKRNDIVIFKKENNIYIKRIIGIPFDTLTYIDNNLIINGKIIEETYLSEKSFNEYAYDFHGEFKYKLNNKIITTKTIPDNYYFLMGDNRTVTKKNTELIPNSYDSRIFGLVSRNEIIGIVSN